MFRRYEYVNVTSCPQFTCHHVRCGSVCGVLVILACSAQILENVDVWRKVDHVLFPAAIRHLDQRVQAADGRAEDVTFWKPDKSDTMSNSGEKSHVY